MTNVTSIDRRCNDRSCEGKNHYVIRGRCGNCRWDGIVLITNGHRTIDACMSAVCPRCECRSIYAGEFVEGNGFVA